MKEASKHVEVSEHLAGATVDQAHRQVDHMHQHRCLQRVGENISRLCLQRDENLVGGPDAPCRRNAIGR